MYCSVKNNMSQRTELVCPAKLYWGQKWQQLMGVPLKGQQHEIFSNRFFISLLYMGSGQEAQLSLIFVSYFQVIGQFFFDSRPYATAGIKVSCCGPQRRNQIPTRAYTDDPKLQRIFSQKISPATRACSLNSRYRYRTCTSDFEFLLQPAEVIQRLQCRFKVLIPVYEVDSWFHYLVDHNILYCKILLKQFSPLQPTAGNHQKIEMTSRINKKLKLF